MDYCAELDMLLGAEEYTHICIRRIACKMFIQTTYKGNIKMNLMKKVREERM
jgi:hypothetical protein